MSENQYLNYTGLKHFWERARENLPVAGHKHDASDITSGVLPVEHGGTGTSTGINTYSTIEAKNDNTTTYSFVANSSSDTFKLQAGTGVSFDKTRDTLEISSSGSSSNLGNYEWLAFDGGDTIALVYAG